MNKKLLVLISVVSFVAVVEEPVYPCDRLIQCYGDILNTIQMAQLYNDSKYFVDMPLAKSEDAVVKSYNDMMTETSGKPSDGKLQEFVDENFLQPGGEFEEWTPDDWVKEPDTIMKINDPNFRSWALDLNELWRELGRKINTKVKDDPLTYSMLYASHPLIVPGGRFREFYYWDSFWIVKGLLVSNMASTAKGMIENFLNLVETYGFIPNGGRIYYTRRSQPPFLTIMTKAYLEYTGDTDFVKSVLSTLEKEYNFWMTNRTVEFKMEDKTLILNRYATDVNTPRPESYYEDNSLISDLPVAEQRKLMRNIASAAESGWDFSSRWSDDDNVDNENLLKTLVTINYIPVDLNTYLAKVEKTLAEFSSIADDRTKVEYYNNLYKNRTVAMEILLWNEEDGTYYDYNIASNTQHRKYFASNVIPLWIKCYGPSVNTEERELKILDYLKNQGVLYYPGGIPTSLVKTDQQWDFPNAWAPLLHMIVEGLATSQVSSLQKEAQVQAQKWLSSNYLTYKKTGAMFEKYDVTWEGGIPGGGGEYDVQKGFGWTNGVVLDFLQRYSDTAEGDEVRPYLLINTKCKLNITWELPNNHSRPTPNTEKRSRLLHSRLAAALKPLETQPLPHGLTFGAPEDKVTPTPVIDPTSSSNLIKANYLGLFICLVLIFIAFWK